MPHYQTIVVAGAGVFGTAMAERLCWNTTNTVIIHSIEADVVADINRNHRNSKYFPTHFLNTAIRATGDNAIFASADYILLVIPSKAIISFCKEIEAMVKPSCLVINLAKGMSDDGAFITEQLPFERTASMKGPSFAIEVLHGLPTAFTFGGKREDFQLFKRDCLVSTGFSLDYTDDIRSVELMSILKNMYAIAIGLVSGRFNSPNVDFLIYTKAVAEMRAFLSLYGCSTETIFRYCGIGDLGLTSLNDLSRNRTLGLLMGKGFSLDNGHSATVIEGSRTVRLMGSLVKEHNKSEEFPIVSALYALMYEGASLNDYMQAVFS
jgi:glycerol-3-phosphate dehydrogenase (NAD(P)+)